MSHHTAIWLAGMSHGGNVVLMPPIVVLGVAMYVAGKSIVRARVSGDSRALRVAISMRWASCALLSATVIFLAFTLVHPGCAALKAEEMGCMSNEKQLDLALLMYAQDNNEYYPPSGQWSEQVAQYVGKDSVARESDSRDPFHCRAADTPWSYGMNAALGGVSLDMLPDPANTVLLFEADARTRSFAGGIKDVAAPRHSGVSNVGFADGHVKRVNAGGLTKFEWTLPPPAARTKGTKR